MAYTGPSNIHLEREIARLTEENRRLRQENIDVQTAYITEIGNNRIAHATEISNIKFAHATEISDITTNHAAEINDINAAQSANNSVTNQHQPTAESSGSNEHELATGLVPPNSHLHQSDERDKERPLKRLKTQVPVKEEDTDGEDMFEVVNIPHPVVPRASHSSMMQQDSHQIESAPSAATPEQTKSSVFSVWMESERLMTDASIASNKWDVLVEAWDDQVEDWDKKVPHWRSLIKPDQCVRTMFWSAGKTTTWTKKSAGTLSCRSCANTRSICARPSPDLSQLMLLPLPHELIVSSSEPSIDMFVVKRNYISQSTNFWPKNTRSRLR